MALSWPHDECLFIQIRGSRFTEFVFLNALVNPLHRCHRLEPKLAVSGSSQSLVQLSEEYTFG